jgi:3-hydroxyisobutyrate dehydrogenase-like beta-hydroxyacid dehydrogenase
MNLGFIGLGAMGVPMAERLLDAGHSLTVYDVNPAGIQALAARGVKVAKTVREVGDEVETVLLSLPTPKIVNEVCLSESGLAQGRAVRTVVDLSTTGTSMARTVQAALAARGIEFIDSPVSGGRNGAIKGTLAVMVSGPRESFDRLSDVLRHIGKLFYIGAEPGMAQTMKLANNLVSAASMAITSEAVAMGVKAGLDPKVMIDVINSGSGMNTASRDKFPKAILPRTFDFGFATALMYKDVDLCMQEAKALDAQMPVADAVHEIWRQTNDVYGGPNDFTRIAQFVEERMGIVIEPPAK